MARKFFVYLFVLSFLFGSFTQNAEAFWPTDWIGGPSNIVTAIETAPSSVANPTTAAASVGTFFLKTADHIKDYVLKPLAIAVARSIIRRITAQTVNWINSGFKGNPMYVTNPGQFFQDQADTAAAAFIQSNGVLSAMCSPFQAKVRLALAKAYLGPEQPFACTLDTIQNNFENFTNDFSQGGWTGWFEMTQSDMGNPYGAYLSAKDAMEMKTRQKQQEKQTQLDQGKGFLSWETCDDGKGASSELPTTEGSRRTVCTKMGTITVGKTTSEGLISCDPPDYCPMSSSCGQSIVQVYQGGKWVDSDGDTGSVKIDAGNSDPLAKCDSNKTRVNTPGSIIGAQLEQHLGTGVRQLELTSDINMLVSALFTQMVGQIVGGIGSGLRGLSQSHSSPNGDARSLIQAMADNSPEVLNESSEVKNNINSATLPQFSADSTSTKASSTDLFWTPPSDQELNNSVNNSTNAAFQKAQSTNGANPTVNCTTDKVTGTMTCQ